MLKDRVLALIEWEKREKQRQGGRKGGRKSKPPKGFRPRKQASKQAAKQAMKQAMKQAGTNQNQNQNQGSKPPIVPQKLLGWVRWWNELQERGLVQTRVSKPDGENLRTMYRRGEKVAEVIEALSDRDRLARQIEASELLHDAGWFNLPKLLGGKNPEKMWIAPLVVEGFYVRKDRQPAQHKMLGPGQVIRPPGGYGDE